MSLTPQFGSITPSQKQEVLASNFLVFDNATDGTDTFAAQYLPEIYEQEVERYGNRTLSGFLRMVGAEMPMTSDQVIWSEQNRLHVAYTGVVTRSAAASTLTIPTGGSGSTFEENVISVNQTIVVMDPATGTEAKCLVTSSNAGTGTDEGFITARPYTVAHLSDAGFTDAMDDLKVFVYGSEYAKGQAIANQSGTDQGYISITPSFTQFSNSPVIIRNKYVVSGSDTAQIGWVEVATEDGTSGYLWYLKAESETRLRFEDYLEMVCVEGEQKAAASGVGADIRGTQGLFAAIEDRGNVNVGP
jgi:hypothetical protein